ncbi:hypothetical protein WG66_003130 [Moniliophthora roreri]|nr:hypothetical protein WG66_003130 [Moniliophthora roreri]
MEDPTKQALFQAGSKLNVSHGYVSRPNYSCLAGSDASVQKLSMSACISSVQNETKAQVAQPVTLSINLIRTIVESWIIITLSSTRFHMTRTSHLKGQKSYISHYKKTAQQAAARAKLAKQVEVAFKGVLLTMVQSPDDKHPET